MKPRCVNIDWLEVFCLEVEPRPAEWFIARNFRVSCRDYGTRVYHEMFTVYSNEDGHELLEVRRHPKNPLMMYNACHIRFVNRACYFDNAAGMLREFLDNFGFAFQRISRIDICLDFVRFDDNTLPRIFMQRYMRGKFSKINQSNISAHGTDNWSGRVWNSVSWGSKSSQVSTKFYNKTLELYDVKTDSYKKPHIRYSWLMAGLIDDMQRVTLQGVTQEIWRLEFSIQSSVKGWTTIELDGEAGHYQSIRSTLDTYATRERLLLIFASLAQHYFHFKKKQAGVRKDRCQDRVLFRWNEVENFVKIDRQHLAANRPSKPLTQLISKIRVVLNDRLSVELRAKLQEILSLLETFAQAQELSNPYSREERAALQILLKRRAVGDFSDTYNAIFAEIRHYLNINNKTLFL